MIRNLKISTFAGAIIIGLSGLISSCKSDDSQIFRAYVEGKITTTDSEILLKSIKLNSHQKTIAQTIAKESGSFVMAGPYETGDYELVFQAKVKSFSSATSGCKISSDSTKIIIPSGITFINFDSITLK